MFGLPSAYNRVPTSTGNHGKPGKSQKKVPCMEKSWNFEITFVDHGKPWKNHGTVFLNFCGNPDTGPLVEPLKPLETFNLVAIL